MRDAFNLCDIQCEGFNAFRKMLQVIQITCSSDDLVASPMALLRKRGAYAVRATESTMLLPAVVGMLLACAFMMLAWRREGR